MLAILFCFSLQRIISGTTDFYGRSYKLSYELASKHILSGEPRWYYITVSDKSVHKEFPLIFTPEHFISPGFFYAFLNDKEYIPINKTNKVKIYPVQPSNKIAEDLKVFQGCKSVLVKAHSSFCQSDQYAYELVGDNLYVVKLKDGDIESLMNNNFVYSIHSIPDIAFQSNHAVGYVQSGQLDFTTDSHKVSFIPRVIHDLGYNGTGEIITITDSGIDVNSTFFKDPNHLVPFNETNPNHYKIYSYWTLTGEYTDYTGHGTHVSGIAAGWPYEGKMSNLSSYGGAAPGSKINFIDVVQRTDFIDSYTISIKLFEYMQKGDSYVSSNSFSLRGRFEGDNVYRNVYDNNSAYNNEYLYVCSAINDPSPNAITVPGSCRNILTVGSLARITTSTTYPSVASTSGRGPIQEGNIKPEVVAPGNSITSACNNHKDICVKSGTSMATPLVSGSILLLREYLKKNYNITRITNTLQRGLIIASADKKDPKTPDTAYGFGILNMSNLITELSNNTILFEDVQLMKDSQVLYEVNVLNNNSDLRVEDNYQTTNMPIYGYDNYDASYDQAIPPTYGSPTNNINYPEYAAMEDDLPPTTPVKKVMNK
ncbi:putative subtilisin-like serine peptidase [Histomonas meleagridis]|uniref:putative subtilisin-like serine peptidase n=1 Tax=Histomonas meleagridis TaxID=135588 RepID=UPI0035597A4D|nr:putative subtilisin-like serine peptidase [Histomonas meleagridis]KAH0799597.1 putative subtilisin-like serine peptidase [Histomonas meleagridis]